MSGPDAVGPAIDSEPHELVDAPGRFPIGPLAWVLITPLVTIPATALLTGLLTQAFHSRYPTLDALQAAAAANPYCPVHISFGGMAILGVVNAEAVCPDGYVLAALSPGLLNLVPILWLLSKSLQTRRVAIIASALGGVRVLVPVVGVLAVVPSSDSGTVAHGFTVLTPGTPWSFPNSWNAIPVISAVLWAATLVAYLVIRSISRRKSLSPATADLPQGR